MRKALLHWPIALILLLSCFDAEWLIPFHQETQNLLGLGAIGFYLLITLISSSELTYQFWFFGWCKERIPAGKKEKVEVWIAKYKYFWGEATVYVVLFAIGIQPLPIPLRTAGVIFCRSTKSLRGFAVLLAGNAIRLGYLILGFLAVTN